ncbi:MAG: response regulator [Chloroflexota bacterium]|nr:response regulator [Chloroflexota bacterium]
MTKILVVDDSALMRRLIQKVLQTAGYEVICAADGQEGLDKIAAEKPDMVIMDRNMPQVDGMEALRALRTNPVTSSLPVLVTSARLGFAEAAEMQTAGANGLIPKPFQSKQLLAIIRQHLSEREFQDNNG